MCFDPFKKSFWQSGRLSFWNLNYSLCSECFLVELTHSFMPIMPCGTYGGYKGSPRPSVPAQLLDGTPGVLHGLELCLHSSVPVFLGLLLLRFPSGVQWRDVRVMLSCSLLMTCPIHLHRLRMMMVSMLSWLQRASRLLVGDGVMPKDLQDSPEVLCVEDWQFGDVALCRSRVDITQLW